MDYITLGDSDNSRHLYVMDHIAAVTVADRKVVVSLTNGKEFITTCDTREVAARAFRSIRQGIEGARR